MNDSPHQLDPRYQDCYFQGPPFQDIDLSWWDDLETQRDAKDLLYRADTRIGATLINDAPAHMLDQDLVATFHRWLFVEVVPQLAGRFRGPEPVGIPVNVEFGRTRKVPGARFEDVATEMTTFGRHVRDLVNQLDERSTTRSPNEFLDDIYMAASYAHCEIVRIHPFPNGNGRTARICINYFLARYGRLLIPIQRPQQDRYIEAAQAWIEHRTVEPFAAFLRSLATEGN